MACRAQFATPTPKYMQGWNETHTVFHCPDGQEEIAADAFRGSELEEIYISKSVKYIGKAAFYGCKHLREVIFADGSVLKEVAGWAFAHCESLASLCLPADVMRIGESCFLGSGLQALLVPAKV